MTEILTESFCERCGTRYTFESAAPRRSRLARVRVLSKGVRNFVMSDDASLSEALADARSEEEIAATSSQLDAFHQTFNFCLTCRQYTCSDCWNGPEGRCLTCAPIPGQEEPTGLVDFTPAVAAASAPTNGHQHSPVEDDEAWPEADIAADRLARVLDSIEDGAGGAHAEAIAAAADTPAEQDAEPSISGLAPGQSLNDAIAAYEDLLAAEEAEVGDGALAVPVGREPTEVAAAAPEPITQPEPPVAAPEPIAEPEPLVAAPEPIAEPEPLVAAPEPVAEPEPEPVRLDRDDVPQPTWPVPSQPAPATPAMPAEPPAPRPAVTPWLTVAPDDSAAPEWPATPQWPTTRAPAASARHDTLTTLAGRPLLQSDATALWAASTQEVLGAAPLGAAPPSVAAPAPTAQPCVSCGLSLSANARFCRRCGSRQG